MLSLVVAVVVYYAAKWWMAKLLFEKYAMGKGFQRGALAFLFAFCASWGVACAIDWAIPSQAFNLGSLTGLAGAGADPGGQGAEETLRAISKAMQAP